MISTSLRYGYDTVPSSWGGKIVGWCFLFCESQDIPKSVPRVICTYKITQQQVTRTAWFNILKPSGYFMYHQFSHFKILRSSRSEAMFFVDLKTDNEFFPTQHSVIGLYNRDGRCLLRGTNWLFKQNGSRFVLNLLKPSGNFTYHQV
jgi:hypothetical protein